MIGRRANSRRSRDTAKLATTPKPATKSPSQSQTPKGSGEPNKSKVGTVTRKQVEEIARLKLPDLNAASLESAIQTVKGTARSMGIEVV